MSLAELQTTALFADYTSDSPSCRVYEPVDVDTTPARWSRIVSYTAWSALAFVVGYLDVAFVAAEWAR